MLAVNLCLPIIQVLQEIITQPLKFNACRQYSFYLYNVHVLYNKYLKLLIIFFFL